MKLLVLSINFKGWIYETLYSEQQAIAKVIPDTVFYGPGFTYNNNRLPDIIKEIYGTGTPDAVICYISEHQFEQLPVPVIEHAHIPKALEVFPLNLNKVKVPKILWINDFWHCTRAEWRKIILKNGFLAIFFTYYPPFTSKETFDNFFDSDIQKQIPFYPLPRAIDLTIFKDYGLPKDVDVTLLGTLDENFYPLRAYFHRTLQKQVGIRYFNKTHPGYAYQEGNSNALTGEKYAQAINRSLVFLSCTGKYKIPFIKLYEVLASRTLLMCDRPMGAEKIGLVDGERNLNNITQIYANTAEWEPDIGTIDVAFIDGCHDTEFVYNDTKKVLKYTKPGSFILWHDFNIDLIQKYDWIDSVCRGVEKLYQEGLIKGRIFHIRDSWVGVYHVG